MTAWRCALALAVALAAGLAAGRAWAHPLAPSFLQLQQTRDGEIAVRWRTPTLVARGARLTPRLPDGCQPLGETQREWTRDALVERTRYRCAAPLVGAQVGVDGLAGSGTDALLWVQLADGSERRAILTAASPSLTIAAAESGAAVFRDYVELGVGHLLGGADHLLFVLGVLLLVRERRALVAAVSAFTVGHSATLALATLGVLRLPQPIAELAIAASLVVLAGEAIARLEGRPALLARRPWLLCFGFGLVHGLGFAGALAALGLPAHAIPLALFAFNVGIELGQLGVIAVALPAAAWLGRLERPLPRWLAELPATAIGTLGVYWCLDRAATALFG